VRKVYPGSKNEITKELWLEREKEEKMRKKIVGFMIAGVLVLVLGFISTPARAEMNLGLGGYYYAPGFGEINDTLGDVNDYYGTDLEFKGGGMYGLWVGWDITPRFGLRAEYDSFRSETSGTGDHLDIYYWFSDYWRDYYLWYYETLETKITLTITPIIFSGIYRFPPFFVGGGMCLIPTKAEASGILTEDYYYDYYDYWYGEWYGPYWLEGYSYDLTESDSDSPIGPVVLGGVELVGGENKGAFLNVEVRYISAEANLSVDGVDTKVDLSGFQAGVSGGFEF